MKEMKPFQIRQAMIEIIFGKKPSRLKLEYPDHYCKIRNEIVDFLNAGRTVRIPVD